MFGLGAGEILIILIIAFLLFGPKQLPEIGRQVGKAVKGFKETADDLKKTVEPELNMISAGSKDGGTGLPVLDEGSRGRNQYGEQWSGKGGGGIGVAEAA